jgi:hypothetical protein
MLSIVSKCFSFDFAEIRIKRLYPTCHSGVAKASYLKPNPAMRRGQKFALYGKVAFLLAGN